MKAAEVKEMSTKEIIEKVELEKGQMAKMRLNHAISPMENTAQMKHARKDIARMLTVLREREINEKK